MGSLVLAVATYIRAIFVRLCVAKTCGVLDSSTYGLRALIVPAFVTGCCQRRR